MKTVPVEMQTIDVATGEVVSQRAAPFKILPPPSDACQVCGKAHESLLPHDRNQLYYQYAFYGAVGRWPTWADATAHCDEEVIKMWRNALEKLGHKWDRPPDGFLPVTDLGPEAA